MRKVIVQMGYQLGELAKLQERRLRVQRLKLGALISLWTVSFILFVST